MTFQQRTYTPISASDLRHRIRIEQFAPVLNSAGDPEQDPDTGEVLQSWQLVAQVWAKISDLSAIRVLQAQQLQSNIVGLIYIRFRDDVNTAMRIVHNDMVYEITGLIHDTDSMREWLQIPVSSGVNAG